MVFPPGTPGMKTSQIVSFLDSAPALKQLFISMRIVV